MLLSLIQIPLEPPFSKGGKPEAAVSGYAFASTCALRCSRRLQPALSGCGRRLQLVLFDVAADFSLRFSAQGDGLHPEEERRLKPAATGHEL